MYYKLTAGESISFSPTNLHDFCLNFSPCCLVHAKISIIKNKILKNVKKTLPLNCIIYVYMVSY